jgi:DNA-binding FadR family transcriptional regulator
VIREAIKSLVAKGLVSTGPKVGTRVLPAESWNWFDPTVVAWQGKAGLTREFLRDLQELRRVLEPASVRLAAERATSADIAEIEDAYAGMRKAIEEGGDYVSFDLRFHLGLLRAGHNRMVEQMGKALGALLRVAFEISTSKADGPASSLPLHRAVLDAVIARDPAKAERASLALIDGARDDMERVMASRRKLPSVSLPPQSLQPAVRASARRSAHAAHRRDDSTVRTAR